MSIELKRYRDMLPEATKQTLKDIKPGTLILASDDIHVNGKVIVPKGSSGKVISRGLYALNIDFRQYGNVLCTWDMVALPEIQNQLELWELA